MTALTSGNGHVPGWEPVQGRPMYRQVADQLRAAIAVGQLTPGETLPAEADLMGVFGVSRPTVRAALAMLRRQGLISTRQGCRSRVRPLGELRRQVAARNAYARLAGLAWDLWAELVCSGHDGGCPGVCSPCNVIRDYEQACFEVEVRLRELFGPPARDGYTIDSRPPTPMGVGA